MSADPAAFILFLGAIGMVTAAGIIGDCDYTWIEERRKRNRQKLSFVLFVLSALFAAPAVLRLWMAVIFG